MDLLIIKVIKYYYFQTIMLFKIDFIDFINLILI